MSASIFQLLLAQSLSVLTTPTSFGHGSSNSTSRSSATLTTSAAIVAGNLAVVVCHINSNNSIIVSSLSDGTNTYTKAATQSSNGGFTQHHLFYKLNAAAVNTSATLTFTYSGASGNDSIYVETAQVSGVTGIDLTGSGTSAVTTGTLNTPSQIIFGSSAMQSGSVSLPSYTGATGFTNVSSDSATNEFGTGEAQALDYKIVSTNASVTFTPTYTNSSIPNNIVVTFVVNGFVSLGSTTQTAGATNTLTTTAAIPSGALVVVWAAGFKGSSFSISSVGDGTNTYTQATQATWDGTSGIGAGLWYKANATNVASGATITITWSATPTSMAVGICAGYIPVFSTLDKTSTNEPSAAATSLTSNATAALATATEVAVGGCFAYSGSPTTVTTEGTNFVKVAESRDAGSFTPLVHMAAKLTTATTAITYNPIINGTGSQYAASVATFQ